MDIRQALNDSNQTSQQRPKPKTAPAKPGTAPAKPTKTCSCGYKYDAQNIPTHCVRCGSSLYELKNEGNVNPYMRKRHH